MHTGKICFNLGYIIIYITSQLHVSISYCIHEFIWNIDLSSEFDQHVFRPLVIGKTYPIDFKG